MKPLPLVPPVPHKRKGQETELLYAIVVALRQSGYQVWRGGHDTHIVNGGPFNTPFGISRRVRRPRRAA